MSLPKAVQVITKLAKHGAIQNYAIAGAVAALNYIQPTLTEDLDILVSLSSLGGHTSGLVLLTPIETALAKMGYTERTDVGYLIEGWPVQFLPAASPLDDEALEQAVEVDIGDSVTARCLRAEHVVATAASLGRPKDIVRIQVFLEQGAVDLAALRAVLARHALLGTWRNLCLKAAIRDPLV
jgi:hypothetical protein